MPDLTSTTNTTTPWPILAGSIATYSVILTHFSHKHPDHLELLVKAISASHSATTTILTVLALSQNWTLPAAPQQQQQPTIPDSSSTLTRLDDSSNVWIAGRNPLANFVTAWEAGYLVYDTGALIAVAYAKKGPSWRDAARELVRRSPVLVVHHVVLAGALVCLQRYIAAGRERGVRVIVALFLMNASNPLLHLRWWRRGVTGRGNRGIDAALAVMFAVARFGTVYWVIRGYGAYHRVGVWEAMRRQRWQCKMGTALLTTLNAVWWLALVRKMVRGRSVRATRS